MEKSAGGGHKGGDIKFEYMHLTGSRRQNPIVKLLGRSKSQTTQASESQLPMY